MQLRTIGILSPGDMGSGLGRVLARRGLRVVAALDERSERTRSLAASAGIVDVGSLDELVTQAEAVLSVLVPSEAVPTAERVASALRSSGADLLYADLNAIAPETSKHVGEIVTAAGARYVDGGIIGNPPRDDNSPRVYLSGVAASELSGLSAYGLDVRVVSDVVGHASGLKMCYACLTKGLTALATELLVCAERLGLSDALRAEQESSQQNLRRWIERQVPSMPPKAYRWVSEMDEIAATLAAAGLPPGMLLGAADVYRWVAQTSLGHETPEQRPRDRTAQEVVSELAEPLPAR